jgi:hypothetical protein
LRLRNAHRCQRTQQNHAIPTQSSGRPGSRRRWSRSHAQIFHSSTPAFLVVGFNPRIVTYSLQRSI